MTDNLPNGNAPQKKLPESEVEQLVYQTLSSAERMVDAEKLRDALLVINEGLVSVPDSHLLKERREQIFLKLQDFLLKTVREADVLSTNEGKLNAFTAVVDLIGLEDLIGIPLDRRRSVYELKNINPGNYKYLADSIIQQSNTFSVAQYDVEMSLSILGQLIARLQTLMKIAPLFWGHLFEFDERLEKSKNELSFTYQKLKEVHSFLEEVNKPDLWEDAVSRGSFEVIKLKRDLIASRGLTNLTSIPEIKEFDQRVRETQEAYKYIKSQVTVIEQAFEVSEDFRQVITLLRRLTARPADWQVVSQREYENILNQMDYLFEIPNIFGRDKVLMGRAEFEAEALRKNEQLNIWMSWGNACEVKMIEAKQFVQVVNGYELLAKNVPIRSQRRDWENVLLSAQSVLDILINPPDRFPENILSRKTMVIFENVRFQIKLAKEWKYSAEQSLKTLDHVLQTQGFPSSEEFNRTVTRNDLQGLKNLIVRAEQIGAFAEDEKKRLLAYKNVYQRMFRESQKLKSWLDSGGGTIPIDNNKVEREQVEKVTNENSKRELEEIALHETMEKAAKEKVQSPKKFRISISYPKLLSKRYESSFLLHVYLPEERSQVTRNIKSEFREQKTNEYLRPSTIKLEQKIRIRLFSPVFDFPESVTKLINNPVNKITFLGMPKDNCEPGLHKVLVSVSDADTDQEFESFTVSVKVVDFAFDHVSRPLLSRVSAIVLGIGSFLMFILTFLEQIDKTVGLTSGTTAGIFALGIYASFYNLYQRVHPNTP